MRVLKRLFVILPIVFALLSFKVSASVLVLTGGLVSTEVSSLPLKEKSIHQWVDSNTNGAFEEFVEEQEEEEDSESSLCFQFVYYNTNDEAFSKERQVKCRKVKRKLFLLYKSYKIDCCKF